MKKYIKKTVQNTCVIACLFILAACADAPKTSRSSELYPTAILIEPIKMRAGFTLTTPAFEITGPEQVWEVSLGFVRRDEKIPVREFMCLVNSRKEQLRSMRGCTDTEPSIHVRWGLLRSDGKLIGQHEYDALSQNATTQSSAAFQVGLSAFTSQSAGMYRLQLTVLRDIEALNITDPQLVIGKPFFRKR